MATPVAGRYASVRLGTAVIGNLGHWEVAITFDELDASVFGTVWKKNMTGMQGWGGTIEGFFDPSTAATDQIVGLMNAALDATIVQDIRFYISTTSSMGLFFMPNFTTYGGTTSTDDGAYISNVRIAHDKNGLASASFNVLGYGELALFQGGSSSIVIEGT